MRPVTTPAVCPRCLSPLRPPDLWNNQWRCDEHGDTSPYHVAVSSPRRAMETFAESSTVPVWVPWPMPVNWYASGFAWAGDDRTGPRATAFAASGPSPLGGLAELVVAAEVPRIGVGARLAGMNGFEPDRIEGLPESKVEAAGHLTGLWPVECPDDRAGFVGEAAGVWLWVVLWPADAALLLLERLVLRDVRNDRAIVGLLMFGAASPHLGVPHIDPR